MLPRPLLRVSKPVKRAALRQALLALLAQAADPTTAEGLLSDLVDDHADEHAAHHVAVDSVAGDEGTGDQAVGKRRVEPAASEIETGARTPHILLVEDNAVNQRVGLALLKRFGYSADTAANGEEAIARLQQRAYTAYAVVLIDIQMPGMDGYEATRLIRDPTTAVLDARIPIIAMTANVLPGNREACLAAGMDDFIAKPIQPRELAVMLNRWLAVRT